MSSSTLTLEVVPEATGIAFSETRLIVSLKDGRAVQIPLAWYPRLEFSTNEEREDFELFQDGAAIHWPVIDEDIRVTDLLAGRASKECASSLERWKLKTQQNRSLS